MSTLELKEKIKYQLDFADERLLKMIYALLEVDKASEVYQFSENEIVMLEDAENDINEGEVLSNKEVEKEVRAWLKSKK